MLEENVWFSIFSAGFEEGAMISYLLYNTILIGSATSAYLAEKLDSKYLRRVFRFFVFLFLTIPSSLRYYTGTDYGHYISIFNNPVKLQSRELLWRYLNYFIKFLDLPVQYLFVFSSILIYYPLCFKLQRKNFFLTIILYIVFMYYFKSYNVIRQMIAVSFVLWAFIEFEKKKYGKTLILLIIALGFHNSAIIIFPTFFLTFITIRGKRLPFIIIVMLFLICIRVNTIEIILSILSLVGSKYARYARSSFYTSKMPIGSGLGVTARLLFPLLTIFFYYRIRQLYPRKKILLNLSFVYIISYVMAAQYVILGRLRDVFIFVPLLISGVAIEAAGKYRKIVLLSLLTLNTLLFEIDIKRHTRDTFSNSIYPYYSIFYKGEIK